MKCSKCNCDTDNWISFEEELVDKGQLCPSCARIMFLYLPEHVEEGEVALVSLNYGDYKRVMDMRDRYALIGDE